MEKNIELEFRVLVSSTSFDSTLQKFQTEYEALSHTKRLSHMGFWKNEDKQFDARVRITNGESEAVLKIGDLHSHDRIELTQPITKDQITGLVRMFAHIAPANYIAERETYNFKTFEGIVISLVKADRVGYIEYELLSDDSNIKENEKLVRNLIAKHGFMPLDKTGFDTLNQSLDNMDWSFEDSPELVEKFNQLLSKY